jgi:hypothetical protein
MTEYSKLKWELSKPEVKKLFESKSADTAVPINTFLASKGFDIKLEDQWQWLYVASVFKQEVKWETQGNAGKVKK